MESETPDIGLVGKLKQLPDAIFSPSLDARAGLTGQGIRVLRTGYLAYREFIQDFCWERAATLTFATIISLLPIAVLVLNIFSLFVPDAELRQFVRDQLNPYLGERQAPVWEETWVGEAMPQELLAALEPPGSRRDEIRLQSLLNNWIDRYVSSDIFRANVKGNLISFVTLIFGALALLVSAERVFNRIWNIEGTRMFFQRFVAFWMILTTSPLLVAATFFVEGLTGEGTVVGNIMSQYAFLAQLLYGFLIPVITISAAFTLINLFLPMTHVRFTAACVGGVFGGVLWFAFKNLFSFYSERALKMESFYGSLAIVPIFLVFVYLTWLVILAGGELTHATQNFRSLVRAYRMKRRVAKYSQPFLGLCALERVVRAFVDGKPGPTAEDLAADFGVYPEELYQVLQALTAARVLTVAPDRGHDRYLPARSPESLPMSDVVADLRRAAFREETDPPDLETPRDGPSHALALDLHEGARKAFLESFEGLTLADLARGGDSPSRSGNGAPADSS